MEKTNENKSNGKQPKKKFTDGLLSVSVFSRKSEDTEYLSFSPQKAYKDKEENWKHTSNLSSNEVMRMSALLQRAHSECIIKEA